MPYAYRKRERLRTNAEFLETMKGKRLSIDGLSLYCRPNASDNYRVGISVGKKIGNAVRRNRLRRRLRACISRALGNNAEGFDLAFVAHRELATKDFDTILTAVTRALRRASVVRAGSDGSAQ